jgi:hypothetical protein
MAVEVELNSAWLHALLLHNRALMELLLAVTGHLYDRNLLDPQAVSQVLETRIAMLANEPDGEVLGKMLKSQIDWLGRLNHDELRPLSSQLN